RLFASVAMRWDGSSSFGKNLHVIAFPKGSLSWLASDEPFFPKWSWLGSFRLRSAYGAAGIQPNSTAGLARFGFFNPQVDGATVTAGSLVAVGNLTLKPETQKEFELGFDADLFRDRVHVEGTRYDRRSTDALVDASLASSTGLPSTGFAGGAAQT